MNEKVKVEREQRKIHFGMTSLKYMVLAEDE